MEVLKANLQYFEGGARRVNIIEGFDESNAPDSGGFLELLMDRIPAQNVHLDFELLDINGNVVASKKGKDAAYQLGVFFVVKNEAGAFSIDTDQPNILEVTGDAATLGAGAKMVIRISGKIDGIVYRLRYKDGGFGVGNTIAGADISGNGVFEMTVPMDYSAGS